MNFLDGFWGEKTQQSLQSEVTMIDEEFGFSQGPPAAMLSVRPLDALLNSSYGFLKDPSHSGFSLELMMSSTGGFLAGGVFKDLCQGLRPKDLDFFFPTEEAWLKAKKLFDERPEWTESYTTEHCVGFHNERLIRVELVRSRFGTPLEILKGFDLTIAQCALFYEDDKLQLLKSEGFSQSLTDKKIALTSEANLERTHILERIFRYSGYGFIVTPEVLEASFKIACGHRRCEAAPARFPHNFFEQATIIAEHGGAAHRAGGYASFGGSLKLMEEVIHELGHSLEPFKSASGYEKEWQEPFTRSLKSFHAYFEKAAPEAYKVHPPMLRLSKSFDALKDMLSPEERELCLALWMSATVTQEGIPWASASVLATLVERAIKEKSDDFPNFIRDLALCPSPPLKWHEWQEYLESDMFSFSTSAIFYGPLFGTPDGSGREWVKERGYAQWALKSEKPMNPFTDEFF